MEHQHLRDDLRKNREGITKDFINRVLSATGYRKFKGNSLECYINI